MRKEKVQLIGQLCNRPPSVAIDSIFEYNDNNQDGGENNGNNDDADNDDYAAT